MATDPKERTKAVELAVSQIERQFGKGSIMKLGERTGQDIAVIPTTSLSVDYALGVGGVPRGRVIEIFGPESSGKTTFALHIVAEAQRLGGVAAFIDAEHALDPEYARKLGCDVDNLMVSQPDSGEQALEITEILIRSSAVDVVVVDSVAALVPKAELDGEMGDAHVGLQARLMSQALRKLTGIVAKSKTALIFINQIRDKIGVMFGAPRRPPAAARSSSTPRCASTSAASAPSRRARDDRLPHAPARREEQGRAPVPLRRVRHPLRRGHLEGGRPPRPRHRPQDRGQVGLVVLLRRDALGQGRENARVFLKDNPDLAREIDKKIRAALFRRRPTATRKRRPPPLPRRSPPHAPLRPRPRGPGTRSGPPDALALNSAGTSARIRARFRAISAR
jgi:recombination protein RecA